MNKVWLKIGEMAEQVGVSPKELRYWEKIIPNLGPRRSKGNLRYYHQEDLPRLLSIKRWLSEGYSVADCRELIQGREIQPRLIPEENTPSQPSEALAPILARLRSLRDRLAAVPIRVQTSTKSVSQKKNAPKAKTKTLQRKAPKNSETRGKMWSMLKLPLDWEE